MNTGSTLGVPAAPARRTASRLAASDPGEMALVALQAPVLDRIPRLLLLAQAKLTCKLPKFKAFFEALVFPVYEYPNQRKKEIKPHAIVKEYGA
jgi:hypothetical protein